MLSNISAILLAESTRVGDPKPSVDSLLTSNALLYAKFDHEKASDLWLNQAKVNDDVQYLSRHISYVAKKYE